jgi:NAD(P)H-hydrate epimerase
MILNNKTISTLDMSIADVNADYLGVRRINLMENAGRGLAEFIQNLMEKNLSKKVLIFAGKGGNGGDGMVAARYLAKRVNVTLLLLGSKNEIRKQSTLKNWNKLKKISRNLKIFEIKEAEGLDKLILDEKTIIIDAIFGTGVKGEIKGIYYDVISFINSWEKRGIQVICVDNPSGIDPNTGQRANIYVKAHFTCVFHKKKIGLTTKNSGQIKVIPIGIPPEAENETGPGELLALSKPKAWTKKGDKGKILIIGGNEKYSGAPALSAMGCFQAGADLVTILTPERIAQAVRCYSPEFIVQDYPTSHLTLESIPNELLVENDVILLGPGLGRHPDTKKAVLEIQNITKSKFIPMVIDADALHLIDLSKLYSNVVLTPHAGEFSVLTGKTLPSGFDSFSSRINIVESVVKNSPAVWLVKGPWDIITTNKKIKVNKSGTHHMTRGGTGDILAGLISGFFMQVANPFYAATISAYINGRAGELAKENFSTMNLLSKIPEVIHSCINFILQD